MFAHGPGAGGDNSELAKGPLVPSPPATSTLAVGQQGRRVTIACDVEAASNSPGVRRPGLYNSELAKGPLVPSPPATSTLPLGSNVAVCAPRAMLRGFAPNQVPLTESYSAALAKGVPSYPPASSTLPSGSKVAV